MLLRRLASGALALAAVLAWPASAQVSITSLGTPVTQDFNTLSNVAASTTNTLTIPGWAMTETGSGARFNQQYAVDTGSGTSGDTYSFGAAGSTERAFGTIQSGSLISTIGAAFTNNTGATINTLVIAYTGEQWRLGTAARSDQLDFQYSLDATSLTTGTWTDVNGLDYATTDTTGTAGPRDGNSATFRTAISFPIGSLTIANGATVWIRWNDFNATSADDGLAIDDFSLTALGAVPSPNLSINDVSQNEGDSGTSNFTFTVSLSSPAGAGGVNFDIQPAAGTASAPSDFTDPGPTTLSIAQGNSSATFNVSVNGDTAVEANETFFVNVTNVTGANVTDGQGLGTIVNDDVALPQVSITGASITEGDSGTSLLNFTVSMDTTSATNVTFNVNTADGTATTANNDYVAIAGGSGTITAGSTSTTVAVTINGDTTFEADETFDVILSGLSANATFSGGGSSATAAGTILNDDAAVLPVVSIANASVTEGNSGSVFIPFTVTLSQPIATDVTFTVNTADGTATTADNDYVAISGGSGTILAGLTTVSMLVSVNGDTNIEPNETFQLTLSNLSANAVFASGTTASATGTITTDDFAPALSIAGLSLAEGNSPGCVNTVFNLPVTADIAPASTLTFNFATGAGGDTATAGTDYIAQPAGTGTIAAGSTSGVATVLVACDTTVEANETFTVTLTSGAGYTITTAAAQGTITNDDASLTIASPAAISEGDSASTNLNFTVTLNPALASNLTFTASTSNGTATGGAASPADYGTLSAQSFTITAGQTTATVPVAIFGDITDEANETFTVALATSDASITSISAPATGTINDDENAPLEIHAIQGNTLRSPLAPASGNTVGTVALTEGNIVTAIGPNGFVIQTPNARADADPLTSQGLYVNTATAPPATLAVGDVVSVKGPVMEFFNFTQITTPFTVVETGTAALPTAVVFDQNRPSRNPAALSCGQMLGNFECFESMLVTVPVGVINSGNQTFGTDPVAEAYATAVGTRARREEGVLFGVTPPANPPGIPVFDGNPEVFELDADKLLPANAGLQLVGGSPFSATGVIGYDFGNHELWPTQLTVLNDTLPRGVPAATTTQMTIGSFNMLRLCETANCASTANPPTAGDIATKIGRLSEYVRTVLRAPDVMGVQEVETIALLQQLATKITADGGPTYTAYLVEGNDVGGIDVGFLVRQDRIANVTVRQLGKNEQITTVTGCSAAPPCTKHDRPPLLLRGTYTANGANLPFAVINNHTRSRGGVDSGAETVRLREKRFAQGESIAQFVQRFQTGVELEPTLPPTGDTATANIPLFLVGDYNAFEVTDGFVDVVGLISGQYDNAKNELQLAGGQIVNPPLLQASSTIPLEERYSYMFAENLGNVQAQEPRRVGNAQIIDHGMVNIVGRNFFRSMSYGRTNADAPAVLISTGTGAVGTSDHDGFVMYIETGDALFKDGFE